VDTSILIPFLDVLNDENMRPDNNTWHPKFPGVVYWGMDWDCPSFNYVLSGQIQKYYGKITPEIAISYLTAIEMSGDNHLAFYDLPHAQIYVSFAKPTYINGPENGYDRQFTIFNLNELFAVTSPSEDIQMIESEFKMPIVLF